MGKWDNMINFADGTVDFSKILSCSFEFVEELYAQIKQPLQERREKGAPEASSGKKSG